MANMEKGMVFGGRYIVQSQVGTGGMATVYRGIDNVLDRPVAIKVMLPQYATDPAFAQRFKQEAQAAAALQNPYIVQVYDWGRDDATGTYYIVMEYLRGTDLKTGIRSHGALAPRKVAQIGAQVCSALAVAHAHDIIHRDIKPQNIMIQPNGDAKVMDFGIARAKNSHLTQTNSVLGTAHYVSPEQAQGKDLGATSDLYSLGVVMYEAATGRLPFDGDDAVSVALKQVNEQAVPPSEVNPNVDDRLESIIMCCMSKDPRRRFQTADELRRALNNYINGRPLGIPAYSETTQLGTATATQVLAGGAGRTSSLHSGATETQRIVRGDERAVNGTQRMGRVSAAMRPPVGAETRPQRRRGGEQRRGLGSGAIAAIVAGIVIVVVAIALLALNTCGGPTNDGTQQGTAQQGTTQQGTVQGSGAASPTETVVVPDVSDKTQQEAQSMLAGEGLGIGSVSQQTDNSVAKGHVISTYPAAKTSVAKGTKINLVISTGPASTTLPTLSKGMAESEVINLLTAAGFKAVRDTDLDGYDPTAPEGTFLTLDPAVGNSTSVAAGTTVKYGLSWGVDPATLKVRVPDVVGWYYTDAENQITGSELAYYEAWQHDDTVEWGRIISLSPAENSEVKKGTEITLYISSGPAPVVIGSYYDWTGQAAQDALTALGLTSTIDRSKPAESPNQVGLVYATNPKSGTEVAKGSSVIVYVYGDYAEPSGTLPTNDQVVGQTADAVAGMLSAWSGVSVTDGTQIIPPDSYANYTVTGIEGAGNTVPYSNTITVYAQPLTVSPQP